MSTNKHSAHSLPLIRAPSRAARPPVTHYHHCYAAIFKPGLLCQRYLSLPGHSLNQSTSARRKHDSHRRRHALFYAHQADHSTVLFYCDSGCFVSAVGIYRAGFIQT